MTDNLEELAPLLAEATPGEWVYCEDSSWTCLRGPDGDLCGYTTNDDGVYFYNKADASLIVALRNAAASLIATAREVEGLRSEVARLRTDAAKKIMDGLWAMLGGDMLPADDWDEINAIVSAALEGKEPRP